MVSEENANMTKTKFLPLVDLFPGESRLMDETYRHLGNRNTVLLHGLY